MKYLSFQNASVRRLSYNEMLLIENIQVIEAFMNYIRV